MTSRRTTATCNDEKLLYIRSMPIIIIISVFIDTYNIHRYDNFDFDFMCICIYAYSMYIYVRMHFSCLSFQSNPSHATIYEFL